MSDKAWGMTLSPSPQNSGHTQVGLPISYCKLCFQRMVVMLLKIANRPLKTVDKPLKRVNGPF